MNCCFFSQNLYPKIFVDSTGQKLVIFTYQQAQKIDNNFELLILLEKKGVECDSLNLGYLKVIDNLESQNRLLNSSVSLLNSQSVDKTTQIRNLEEQLSNCQISNKDCDSQIKIRDEQIVVLKKELKTVKRKRNITYASGILGTISAVLLAIFIK
jgi:hypothetical protein